VDATGSYHAGWAGVTTMFLAATVLTAFWHRVHRRPRRT
jgi:hypothetical protein